MSPIKVLLADDHGLVRAGIRVLLESLEGVQVVAEAEDGHAALRLVELHRPDVVLMDIAMKGLNGLDATLRIQRDFPDVKVVILSMHANEEYVLQSLRAGATGYLLKDAGTDELQIALKAVARGETYLSPPVSKHVISDYIRRVDENSREHSSGDSRGSPLETGSLPLNRLTLRQREILQMIAEGNTTQEIAQKLSIGAKTVETHRMQLMKRLNIHDVAGLVRFAVRVGLVRLD